MNTQVELSEMKLTAFGTGTLQNRTIRGAGLPRAVNRNWFWT
jgi:hypothetical protein